MLNFKNLVLLAQVILASFLSTSTSLAETAVYIPSKAIPLDLRYQEQLDNDRPFADVKIDAKQNVWIVGRTTLWCWPSKQDKLLRITVLPPESTDRLISFVPKQNGFFVASNTSLFDVNVQAKTSTRALHPLAGNGRTFQLVRSKNSVWWVSSLGLVVYPAKGKSRVLVHTPQLANASGAWFDTKEHKLWLSHKGDLSVVEPNSTAQYIIKDHYNEAIISLSFSDKSAIAHTNHTVLRYNRTKPILEQIIAVQKPRRLVAFDGRGSLHSYLFHDRLLEIFDTASGSVFNTQLALNFKDAVIKIAHISGLSAVLSESRIAVFQHPDEQIHSKSKVLSNREIGSPTL